MSKPWDALRTSSNPPIGSGFFKIDNSARVGLSVCESMVGISIGQDSSDDTHCMQYFIGEDLLEMAELFTELATQLEG